MTYTLNFHMKAYYLSSFVWTRQVVKGKAWSSNVIKRKTSTNTLECFFFFINLKINFMIKFCNWYLTPQITSHLTCSLSLLGLPPNHRWNPGVGFHQSPLSLCQRWLQASCNHLLSCRHHLLSLHCPCEATCVGEGGVQTYIYNYRILLTLSQALFLNWKLLCQWQCLIKVTIKDGTPRLSDSQRRQWS